MKDLDEYREVKFNYYDHIDNHRYIWDSFSVENPIIRDDGATLKIPTEWERKAWKNTTLHFRVQLMISWIEYTRENPNVVSVPGS